MKNIAVFASGSGSGLQAIIDASVAGVINVRICLVISNNSKSIALERARKAGIPAYHLSAKTEGDDLMLERSILATLTKHNADAIFLAGYLKKVGTSILHTYKNNIYNIHPSMLPKYGGHGMYGINVHRAVIAAGEVSTGITIHRVDPEYDTGEIIAQRTVEVKPDDTAESLAARVLAEEHVFLVQVLGSIFR